MIGAFVGFSSTSVLIDFDKRRIKFSNNLFGIIRIGKWIEVKPEMKLGIRESNVTWRAFSRSNRSLEVENNDFRLILMNNNEQEIMELKKVDSLEKAKTELAILCSKLELKAIEWIIVRFSINSFHRTETKLCNYHESGS